jgi:hypothetical protein
MPGTVLHVLSATTPDNTSYEIRPSHWNSSHAVSLNVVGSEIIGAFSNANSVTFGTTPDGHITVSVGSNQSNQTIGVSALGNTTINSASTFDARSLGISGAGNISVGIVGSNLIISATGGGGGAGSGVVALAAGTNVVSSGTAAFGNANNVTFGADGAGNITASASYQTGINFSASNAAANLSSIVFGNANGVSFGLNGSTLTAAYTQQNTAGLLSAINVSAGTTSANLSALSFADSNSFQFGFTNGSLTINNTGNNSSFAIGNTIVGTMGSAIGRSVFVSGAGNVSIGITGNTLIVSGVGGVGGVGVAMSAGTNSISTGTAVFANSNGVTFGMQTNGVITATVNPGPAAGMAAIIAGTQTQTTGTLLFANSNGITFGMSNSSVITAIYTVPTQQPVAVSGSNGSYAYSTLSLAVLNGAAFYTTNGSVALSYTVPSVAGLLSAVNISAGTQASNVSALTFGNANNVSFGLNADLITASAVVNFSAGTQAGGYSAVTLANANGISFGLNNGTITASYTQAAQTNQTLGLYARGNTTGAGSSSTYDARSFSLSGIGNIYVGNSGGAFIIQDTASGGGANTFSGYAVSNTTLGTTGTLAASALSFAGAGAVSIGLSNGSVVISAQAGAQSVQTMGVYAEGNTTGTSSSTYDARFLSLVGLGMITVGNSNGSIVISGPNTTTLALLSVGLSTGGNTAGNTGLASNQLVLAGGSNITLSGSTNAGSMTISIIGAGGGANTASFYAAGNTTQNSSGTVALSALSIQGAGIVSLGYSNGSLVISATGGGGGASSGAVYLAGNTTAQSSSSTFPLSSFNISGAGLISIGWSSNTLVVSGPGTTGISQSMYALGNTTQSSSGTGTIGALSVVGAGNVSVGVSNGSLVISATGGGGGGGGVALSAGTNSTATGTVVFSNANGVSFGMNTTGVVTASVAGQSNQTEGLYALGNTVGLSSSSTFDARTQSISGAGAVSVGFSGNAMLISAPATSSLVGTGQVSVSLNGSTISVGVPILSLYATGNTTQGSSGTATNGSLLFNGAGIVSLGYSNGSLVISATGGGGGGGVDVSLGGNTAGVLALISTGTLFIAGGNNVTVSQNANSFTISGANAGGAQTGISGLVVSNTTYTSGTVTFQNANGVSFGSSGANGISVSFSAPATTAAYYFLGNSTGASSSSTGGDQTLSISMAGIISGGWTNGSWVLSATQSNQAVSAAGGSSVFQTLVFTNSNNVSFSNTGGSIAGSFALNVSANGGTSNALSAITFSNSNGVTFGLSTGAGVGTMTASVAAQTNQTVGLYALGNTTQNSSTTLDARSLSFNGLGAMTVGYSNGSIQHSVPATSSLVGINGELVSVNGSTISIGPALVSRYDFWPQGNTSSSGLTVGSASFRYVQLQQGVSFTRIDVPAVFSIGSGATTATADLNISSGLVIYSRNGSTLSPIAGAFGTTTLTWASNSSNWSNLTGGRNISFPINGSLTAGEYWIGFQLSTTNNSSLGLSTTLLGNTISMVFGLQDTVNQYGDFGSTYSVSQNLSSQGLYTATLTATNQTVAMSNVSAAGTAGQLGNFPVIFRNY